MRVLTQVFVLQGSDSMCAELAQKISQAVTTHEAWRQKCLNLIPSENMTSPQVREMLASDFGHRYAWDQPWYGGQKYTIHIEELAIQAAKKLFNAKYANVRPLSGHLSLPLNLQARFPLDVQYFPYQSDQYSMDVSGAKELIERTHPKLVILGASIFLQPHPVRELAKVTQEAGSTLVFDGSHVLGLIAGGQFQNPFREGTQILLGSTHKTFFGPQGGIILVRDDEDLAEKIDATLRPNPVLVDNYHHHRVAALAIALTELLAFGKEYARQVVQNAQELARSLDTQGVPVIGESWDFTSSHQVLLQTTHFEHGREIRDQLEEADIIADIGVRLGSQEVTRRGMKQPQMQEIATLIARRLEGERVRTIKKEVHQLTSKFDQVEYCFSS